MQEIKMNIIDIFIEICEIPAEFGVSSDFLSRVNKVQVIAGDLFCRVINPGVQVLVGF
jgi:hypothetical protein